MNSPFFRQMLDALDQGVFILDPEGVIRFCNHWMLLASGRSAAEIEGKPLFGLYPQLDTPLFHRNFKSVLRFGNTAFFSNQVNPYLIPLPPPPDLRSQFEFMQQSGQMGPLRDDGEVRLVYLLIRDISQTITNVQQLTRLAMRDALTGIWNRRWFDHWLREEVERAERYKRTLSLIMIDIDHFKAINDTYGHQAGDAILTMVASTCNSLIRTIDTLARYGGEEFCVILPETASHAATALAERLRVGVESQNITTSQGKPHITISAGVCQFAPGQSPDELIKQADSALYRAKQLGRNRVELI